MYRISEKAHLRSDFRKKKYFFEWGSNPQKYYFGAIFRAGQSLDLFCCSFISANLALKWLHSFMNFFPKQISKSGLKLLFLTEIWSPLLKSGYLP